jgi:hypothetical protein
MVVLEIVRKCKSSEVECRLIYVDEPVDYIVHGASGELVWGARYAMKAVSTG